MAKQYSVPGLGILNDKQAGIKTSLPGVGVLVQFPTVAGGTKPQNPMGHPIKGALGGPIG